MAYIPAEQLEENSQSDFQIIRNSLNPAFSEIDKILEKALSSVSKEAWKNVKTLEFARNYEITPETYKENVSYIHGIYLMAKITFK